MCIARQNEPPAMNSLTSVPDLKVPAEKNVVLMIINRSNLGPESILALERFTKGVEEWELD